jgi:hypothetical protein
MGLMPITVFGIRHHGPGSARSLQQSLQALQPDIVLIEGPPEANDLIALAAAASMKPPVALLVYDPDHLQQAAYYPFAVYSPEWQAIQYALAAPCPVRFIDLPVAMQFAAVSTETPPEDPLETLTETPTATPTEIPTVNPPSINLTSHDPLALLAQTAGFDDSDRYWDYLVEQRQDPTDLFAAILEAMTHLRTAITAEIPESTLTGERTLLREAHMRQCIRQAEAEGFSNIAVVCGAWHAPTLIAPLPPAKPDQQLLKGVKKAKVAATWVPWSYGRLSMASGYGAGVQSPGWYHHLWTYPTQTVPRWLTRVARLLRQADIDASAASVIEAVRFAETLAALRNCPLPGLSELNEAAQTILCFGEELPMQVIQQKLIISDRLGQVPADTPQVPLQQDLHRLAKRLRLKQDPSDKSLELDLRQPTDLERSQLLHRLQLLGIDWGKHQQTNSQGTFKEGWLLRWQPEFEVVLIERGVWGNTVELAATGYACDQVSKATDLPSLTGLLDQVLIANLGQAIPPLMQRLQAEAAIASDILHLIQALPPLANILRYSDVRQTNREQITPVVDGLVSRLCIGLAGACQSLDDAAAGQFFEAIQQADSTIKLLQVEAYRQDWQQALLQLTHQAGVHGLVQGRCCRLLFDGNSLNVEQTGQRLSLALSTANDPGQAAAWLEGFLTGSGLLLLHSQGIWEILDAWVTALTAESFPVVLPLLRRTFASFASSERRQMGERVAKGEPVALTPATQPNFDPEQAQQVIPVVAQLLGLV